MTNYSYDDVYDIRLARYSEIDEVMEFIDSYWKKGHILASSRDFFEYEMVNDKRVNFVIAKRKDNNSIEGIQGFIPCSNNKDKQDVWGVIWKVKETALPLLGIELKRRMKYLLSLRAELGTGVNAKTAVPILSFYGYYIEKMKHYYCLASVKKFTIAKITNWHKHIYEKNVTAQVQRINNIGELHTFFDFNQQESSDILPYKDAWYFDRRFFSHPIYNYDVWGICGSNHLKAIIVTREQKCNGSSAIRIVDYWGEQKVFAECGEFLDQLLASSEYVDFYFSGFDEKYVQKAGMIKVNESEGNIIPDYFNPFEQTNVDIYVSGSEKNKKYSFFKADGDQDRPS